MSEALVRTFVDVLYPPGSVPGGYLTISVADPKVKGGPLRSYHFRTDDSELEIAVAALDAQGLNVYHGVGLHGRDLGTHVRGTKKDVTALPGFWVDIDVAGPGHVATDLPPTIGDAVEGFLSKFDFAPSVGVLTGGGLHLYWLFDKPLLVTDANRDELGKLSKTFQERLGAHGKAVDASRGGPWRLDNTSDIARVLRPVGTHNHKPSRGGDPPLVEWSDDPTECVRYPFSVLRAFLTTAAKSDAKKSAGVFASRPVAPSLADAVADSPVPPPPETAAPLSEWTYEKTQKEVLDKVKANKRDERKEIFGLVLAGKPFARPGERDVTLQRVASWLAFFCPDGDPEAITDILTPSLDAMEAESPGDFLTWEQAFEKVCRAQGDGRAKEAVKKEAAERLATRLFKEARGGAGREKAARAPGPNPFAIRESRPSPSASAAPDATPTTGDGSETSSRDAAHQAQGGTASGESAVVPGVESPGGAALGPSGPRNPFAIKGETTALALVPRTDDVAPVEPDEGNGTHYTRSELEAFCAQQGDLARVSVDPLAFKKRFIIQRDEAFYVYGLSPLTGKPGYLSPIRRGELPVSLTRDLVCLPEILPDPGGDAAKNEPYFSWHVMRSDNTVKRKTVAELIDELGTNARALVADMTIPASYYDPSTQTFYEATCPVRDLTPEYSPHVARWLELLAGAEHDLVLDWIATLTDLTYPTCGLFLYGAASSGKSMLAHGLARLWTTGAPTNMQDANGSFNSDIASCPLVVADEYLPLDSNGKPMSTKKLRDMISLREHTMRRKFMPNSTLKGALRAMFLANNEDMLSQNDESLGPDALAAVALRFLYVPVGEEASEFLRSIGGNNGTADWVDGDRIARHALWLRDNRPVKRFGEAGRFLVEGRITKAHNALATSGTVPGLVVEWLARFLVTPQDGFIKEHTVILGAGRFLVNAAGLLKNWNLVMGETHKAPNLQRLNKVLGGISTKKEQVREQRGKHRGRYWEIKPEVVIDYAEKEGLAKGEASELWDKIKGPEIEHKGGGGVFGGKQGA